MADLELKFEVNAKIRRPVGEVFEAVYNPEKLRQYFTTGGASGPLDPGRKVIWKFQDYLSEIDHLPVPIPVEVKEVVRNESIVMEWGAADGDHNCRVEMSFESLGPSVTLVQISESGWQSTPKGLKASYDNCAGWMQMTCCLKAFLENGINLREGIH